MEFFNGTTLLKTERTAPYHVTWSNAPAGTHKITAKATDNSGRTTTTSVVTITIASATSAIAESNAASLSEVAMQPDAKTTTPFGFNVSPNPATDKIFVSFNGPKTAQPATITIRNLGGGVLKTVPVTLSGSGISVDVSSLRNGMYIVSVTGEDFSLDKKFLKAN